MTVDQGRSLANDAEPRKGLVVRRPDSPANNDVLLVPHEKGQVPGWAFIAFRLVTSFSFLKLQDGTTKVPGDGTTKINYRLFSFASYLDIFAAWPFEVRL